MMSNKKSNQLFYIFLFILTMGLNIIGSVAGKYIGINLGNIRLMVVWIFILCLSLLSRTATWAFLNKRFKLSFIYPILSLNYLLSLIIGRILFDEPITPTRILGTAIIVFGVFFITISKDRLEEYQV